MTIFKTYHIKGLTCAACAVSSQKVIGRNERIKLARVNFATATATVEVEADQPVPLDELNAKLNKLGFELSERGDAISAQKTEIAERNALLASMRKRLIISMFLGLPLIVIGMVFHHADWANWAMFALCTPLLYLAGGGFYVRAWQLLKQGTSNMDTLVALGSSVAYGYSLFNLFFPHILLSAGLHPFVYFEAAGGLLFFILIGKYIEEKAKGSTHAALDSLLALQPSRVNVFIGDEIRALPLEAVQVGDLVLIKSGEAVPVDAEIVSGEGECVESMLTGEPLPLLKTAGEHCFAGTQLLNGTLKVRVEALPSDTMLMRIVALVQNAQASEVPIQKTVDKISAIFVPVIVIIALSSFLIWYFWLNNFSQAVVALISVLVVACPCALGLATPTALIVGIGAAAKRGILLKNARALEVGNHITDLVVDKTGTLTLGRPAIDDILNLGGSDQDLAIICNIQRQSSHPVGQAIAESYAIHKGQSLPNIPINAPQPAIGKGISADYEGINYRIGSPAWLADSLQNLTEQQKHWCQTQAEQARSIIWATKAEQPIFAFAISDAIRPEAREVIQQLQQKYKIRIHLCTGDQAASAQYVAQQLGIQNIHAQQRPEDKLDLIQALQNKGKLVAMLGDGINDAAALKGSNLGIAVHSQIDLAADCADVVLLREGIESLPKLFHTLLKTNAIISQNLFWAFAYNALMVPLAAGAFIALGYQMQPMWAGAAMAFSSVTVVLNSLRLRF